MKNDEFDRILKHALMENLSNEYEEILHLEKPETGQLKYPDSFYRKIRKISANPSGYGKKSARPPWRRALQSAAVFILTLLLSTGGLMAVSPTVRAAVVNWVKEVHEGYVMYDFRGEETSEEKRFAPTWVPEGYTNTKADYVGDYGACQFENGTDDAIFFNYSFMQEGSAAVLPASDSVCKHVKVGNSMADLYIGDLEEHSSTLIWIDNKLNYMFTISGFIEEKELIKMAESVELQVNYRFNEK